MFTDLDLLMANVVRVTAHLGARAAGPRRAVRVRQAADGRPYARDATGAPWRTLALIDGARTNSRFSGPAEAGDGAAVAARLVADLADLDPPPGEVIPGFHDIPRRLDDLRATPPGDCGTDVAAVLAHAGIAERAAAVGLPVRTVHNDAKTENLLVDDVTGRALCLVDLDTVGPGTVLSDVGDLVRSGAVSATEDAGSVTVDHRIVAAVLDGYATAGAGFLTPAELDFLALAGPLMALEAAARFLTDHLRGDVYFRVDGPGHNLRRARNQLRVLEQLVAR